MGQTLGHGIYLPDEGERNCYSGLAANWQLLDGAVGTIAEHTSALLGKAPLVHTHVKSDITDFPAYGNTAGTICEGNDSRLSDARTPVSHTHTKSDVTDLLNSNFIPSANNSYGLGSSSYQWKSVYAQSYYYNGTAWGLDKTNFWTSPNYFTLSMHQKGFSPRASAPASNEFGQLGILDTDGNSVMSINYANRITGARDLTLRVSNNAGNANGVGVFKDASDNYSFCSLDPNNTINLGTSTNKWKTLNGINPGALSLPDLDNTYRWSLDTTNWVLDGSSHNTFTPNFSGWLNIRIPDVAGNYILMQSGSITVSNQGTGTLPSVVTRSLSLLIPVVEGVSGTVRVKAASIVGFFYPALGNPVKTTQSSS